MEVIKRNGDIVKFEREKVENAIVRAMKNGSGIYVPEIAKLVAKDCEEHFQNETPTIYQIEKYVYERLVHYGQTLTARAYEGYRAVQQFKREANTTDESIMGLINRSNEDVLNENSNKNGILASTQRDLIAGEISKDIARRKLIPAHIVQAHDEGVIHWHDMDYTMQPIHNCFSGDTKFVTHLGVLQFNQCNHGQQVEVLDKNGQWRKATVKKYGKQKLQKITMTSGRTVKVVRATENHRWLLKDGTITTDLKVGDRLHLLKDAEVDATNNDMFCFGFVLGDGNDFKNGNATGLTVRLCGDKVSLLDRFIDAGYSVSKYKPNDSNDVFVRKSTNLSKKEFLESKAWRYMSKEDKASLFLGYYMADGFKDGNGIATSNDNLALMIREISSLAGYYVASEKFQIRNTNYKEGAKLYTFGFIKKQNHNKNWVIKDINRDDKHLYDVWCVEEPVTQTFTLNGGIVTGNCCLINLEDMLQNGTVINDKLVEKPKSFSTACTVVTQVIAAVASSQFGGCSVTIKHIAPFLRVSEEKFRKQSKERYAKNFPQLTPDLINELVEKEVQDRLKEELKAGIQTIRYQLSTLNTSNGQLAVLFSNR